MRHVITGGSGFTGSVLTRRLLAKGETVINFDIVPNNNLALTDGVEYVQGDIRNANDLKKLNLTQDDVVYHLAARQFANDVPKKNRTDWFFDVNVSGTKKVVETMLSAGVKKMVFFSTDMTYGLPTITPVPPTHAQNPLGPYGESKVAAEKIIRNAVDIHATIFRPRLITGPGRLGILGKLFKLIKAGLPIPMIGNGLNRYQMVSVEDCAIAAEKAVSLGCPPGPFNLGSSLPPTTKELLQGIINHAQSNSFVIPVPASMIKPILATLDKCGLTLLYPEQYGIADKDVLLDTTDTNAVLNWHPSNTDIDEMCKAYDAFVSK